MRTVSLVTCLAIATAGCALVEAIDDKLHAWPKYAIPGSHASIGLPGAPRFSTEALQGSPCGELVRTTFAVKSQFALYSGSFIPMAASCAGNPTHAIGLQMLVTPRSSPEWHEVSSDMLHVASALSGRRVTFRREGSPPTVRTAHVYLLAEGVLGLVAEAADQEEAKQHADKFLREVSLGAAH